MLKTKTKNKNNAGVVRVKKGDKTTNKDLNILQTLKESAHTDVC